MSDGHAKKSDGHAKVRCCLNTFVTSHNGDVISDITAIYFKSTTKHNQLRNVRDES